MLKFTCDFRNIDFRQLHTVSVLEYNHDVALREFNQQAQATIQQGFLPISDLMIQPVGEGNNPRWMITQQFAI